MDSKIISISPDNHTEIKIGAATAKVKMIEYADEIIEAGLTLRKFTPKGLNSKELLTKFQTQLKCSDEEDVFKILWLKLGNEWPPNIEVK